MLIHLPVMNDDSRPANVPAHILQANVESITKHKVFLDSNPAINKLGKDLLKLRNLLTHTQKIIEVFPLLYRVDYYG